MDVAQKIVNVLVAVVVLIQFALIMGTPVFALQYLICKRRVKLSRWLLPMISIGMLLLSAFFFVNSDIREQAKAWVTAQFGMYSGAITIEGILPVFSIVMTLAVTAASVLCSRSERRRKRQGEQK